MNKLSLPEFHLKTDKVKSLPKTEALASHTSADIGKAVVTNSSPLASVVYL